MSKSKKNVLYKITSRDMRTYGGFKWELGKKYEKTTNNLPVPVWTGGIRLCSPTVFHAFEHPLQMLVFFIQNFSSNFLNNVTYISRRRFFLAEGSTILHDHNKVGTRWLILKKELCIPRPTKAQLVELLNYALNRLHCRSTIHYPHKVKTRNRKVLLEILDDVLLNLDRDEGRKRLRRLYNAYDRICGKSKIKVARRRK